MRPSFVVVVAAAGLAACDAAGFDELRRGSTFREPEEDTCTRPSECVSSNPPPPPPIEPPRPVFGETVTQDVAPPPLGAASMIVTSDGTTVVATDPDRDRVVAVDLATKEVREIALEAGDEPGRLVEDASKQVHVVLDRAGAIATIDLATTKVVQRRPVCASPQGIAHDGSTLFVACAGGEIATLPAAGAEPATVLARIDRDLRDVVVAGESLLVSRLRSAEVLRIRKTDGELLSRAARRPASPVQGEPMEPAVGWRLVSSGAGGAVLVHQLAQSGLVDAAQSHAYAGLDPCGGPVRTVVTTFAPTSESSLRTSPGAFLGDAVVPVDIAPAPDGKQWAVIAAGNGHTPGLAQVHVFAGPGIEQQCVMQPSSQDFQPVSHTEDPPGQAVAVAFTPDSDVLVLTREPAAIHRRPLSRFFTESTPDWEMIPLGGASREDTGHAIFHSNTGGRIACVSCHPGGGDDGRVWQLASGPRRTQTLQGTLDGTAPYHWSGDVSGIDVVVSDVFVEKMGGLGLDAGQVDALRSWVTRIPAPPVSAALDADASARGKALFEDATVGCSGCHSGPKLTNNESVDVGTGGKFQVPSLLGLSIRAPYLHDGRAATLRGHFGASNAGSMHGKTSQLTSAELDDLVVYLETL